MHAYVYIQSDFYDSPNEEDGAGTKLARVRAVAIAVVYPKSYS